MVARDVVMDEINIKSVTLKENDSVVKHDFNRSHDSPMEENEESDFPLQEMNE